MLQLRICPKCGAEVKSKTAYFCYACGKELEPPKMVVSEKQPETKSLSKEVSIAIPAFLLTAFKFGFLFLIILALGTSIGIFYLKFRNRITTTKKLPTNQAVVGESFQPLGNVILGKGVLPEATPANVDLYLEGTKPEIILPKIFGESLEEDFASQIDLEIAEAASFLEEKFALFERENPQASPSREIAFVSRVINSDFVEKKLEGLSFEESSLSASLIEDYLVVTNSQNLVEDVERSLRKLSLSLALKTEFAESLRHLPEKGQLLVYLASRNKKESSKTLLKAVYDWISENLTGNGFIILEENGRTKVVGEES